MQAATAARSSFAGGRAVSHPARRRSAAAARRAVAVRALGKVPNKQLLEVAQQAAAAGAKVGGCQGGAERRLQGWALPPCCCTLPHRRRCCCCPQGACRAATTHKSALWVLLQVIQEAVDKPRSNVQSTGSSADLVTETGGAQLATCPGLHLRRLCRAPRRSRRLLHTAANGGAHLRLVCGGPCCTRAAPAVTPRTSPASVPSHAPSAADVASEKAILAAIQAAFPSHAVLGEEGGVSGEHKLLQPAARGARKKQLSGHRPCSRPGAPAPSTASAASSAPVAPCVVRSPPAALLPAVARCPQHTHSPPLAHTPPIACLLHTPSSCTHPPNDSRAGDTNSEYLWCVDPLDGTTNFAHGYPSFAVSVAVLRHITPVASTGAAAGGAAARGACGGGLGGAAWAACLLWCLTPRQGSRAFRQVPPPLFVTGGPPSLLPCLPSSQSLSSAAAPAAG